MKADLHIHSTVSDGSESIETIVEMAKAKGLSAIAITDHDTVSHFDRLPEFPDLRVLPGVELSAWDYGLDVRVHILAYRLAWPEAVEAFALPTLLARHANSLRQIQVLQDHGCEIDLDRVPRADGKYIYKQHIMQYLMDTGVTEELFGNFYYRTFKNGGICHFDIRYPDACEAVEAVKRAGGLAVLAHPGQQQNFELIPKLVAHGLDGLELHHHSNSELDEQLIRQYAKKYRLFLTGGSDFHGRYEAGSPAVGEYLAEESGILVVMGE
jgi:predicted metal-dependent phosphoesterase TrpH